MTQQKIPIEIEEQKLEKSHGFELITKNGYKLDEVVSALQKEIRRGNELMSKYWALEMNESGYWRYCFRRMMVIAGEDVGLANPEAMILVSSTFSALLAQERIKKVFHIDNNVIGFMAIYLARSPKSRHTDYLGGVILKQKERGWKIAKIFKEEGESAKAADRTQLKELMEYCRINKGKVQVCLVYKIDRFARNQMDHYAIKARLLEYGVSVRSATEPVDDTPIGKVIEGLFAAVAQLDNDIKSQRVKESMRNWVLKGKWVWGAKPGYINQKDETDHALILLDPDKAPAITELFTKFSTSHYTYKNLSDWLNNDKHLSGKQGKKFHPQGVQRILKDKFYMGIISMYEQEIKGVHDPLTDEYTFYKCQEIMISRSNKTTKKRTTESEDFPMRRFLFCPSCNQKLTAAWCKGRSKKYPKYYCVTKGCELRSKSYRRENVHDEFYNLLKKVKPSEDCAGLFKEMFIRVYHNRIQELEGDTIRIKAEIES